MKRWIHRLAHLLHLNAQEMIVVHDEGEWLTFFRCCVCGELEKE